MSTVRFRAMGTDVHLVTTGLNSETGDAALSEARAFIHDAESRLSRFRPDSELSQINRSAGRPTVVSAPTMQVLVAAKQAWLETDGAYDPTLGSELCELGYATDFDSADFEAAMTTSRRDRPDRRTRQSLAGDIVLDDTTNMVLVPDDTRLDLGGIAKGATADTVVDHLLRLGASGACVNIGGDLRVAGVGPDDGTWTVGLPCAGARESRTLRLAEGAIATSSTKKRQWPGLSGPVHHLLDPQTGQSRVGGPLTVSVVAASATAAEVITKWMMAGGDASHFDATGLTIDQSGEITHEPGLDAFLVS